MVCDVVWCVEVYGVVCGMQSIVWYVVWCGMCSGVWCGMCCGVVCGVWCGIICSVVWSVVCIV